MAKRLDSLQVLRAVAAFAVVMDHFEIAFTVTGDAPSPLFALGTLGVDIFFVLSGYVMATIASRAAGGGADAAAFLLKRAGRLLPIYWFVLLLQCLGMTAAGTPPTADMVAAAVLMVPNFFSGSFVDPIVIVSWSLFVEIWFYAATAAAILLARSRMGRTAIVCGTVLAVIAAANVAGATPRSGMLGYYGMSVGVEFPLGWLLATFADKLRTDCRLPALVALVAGIALLATGQADNQATRGWTAAPIGAAAMVWATVQLQDAIDWRRGLGRLGVLLGDASYSIYLLHITVFEHTVPLLRHLKATLGPTPGEVAWAGSVTVLVAALACIAHRVVEAPLNRDVSGMADRWLEARQHLRS